MRRTNKMSDLIVIEIEETISSYFERVLTEEACEALKGAIDTNELAQTIWLERVVPIIDKKDMRIEELEDNIENMKDEMEDLESEFEESE
jgi:hypothetical protein